LNAQERIRRFILTELNWAGSPEELTDDYPLIRRRAVDSLDTLRIAVFLEKEFGVTVADSEMTHKNFSTISALATFVVGKRDPVK
jgi:acyl carrier protein